MPLDRKRIPAMLLAAVLLLFLTVPQPIWAAKKKQQETAPVYKTSGTIPGTTLVYEKLFIDQSGKATVQIINPSNTGLRFVAHFTFYNNKNENVAGFSIDGFAGQNTRTGYTVTGQNYAQYKGVVYVKVLGRAGRTIAE